MTAEKIKSAVLVVLLLSSISLSAAGVTGSDKSDVGYGSEYSKEMVSVDGVKFNIQFSKENLSVTVVGENTKMDRVSSWLALSIGRTTIRNEYVNLTGGETWTKKFDLRSYIPADKQNHSLSIGTFGNHTSFNFSLDVSSADPKGVELPEIQNVEIDSVEVDGEETAVARITVRNEARVQYLTNIRVSTLHTNTDGPDSRVPMENDTRVVVVRLNEDPDMKVAGEVRLYTRWIHNDSFIQDQVEFVGTPDGETAVWNRSYEPIMVEYADTDPDEVYHYQNASVEEQNDAIWRERLEPIAIVAVGFLVVFLVVVAVVTRLRR
ncbi:hypothetical protein [Haloarchaeobius sp. DFWS5]|uniref:hypothetical protein n=1 Tax=Haloarchaeobius sp. DFWS5 TaxID=3446114 RepID=UPI003EBA0048